MTVRPLERRAARRNRVARSDALLAGLLALAVGAALVAAIGPHTASLDTRAARLEAELRCPVCQGVSIADSPAQMAQEMRALVRDQLAAGASDDQVLSFFVARYGRWILLTPSPSGLELGLWLAPGAIVVAGALCLVLLRRRAAIAGDVAAGRQVVTPGAALAGPIRDAPAWIRLGVAALLVAAVAAPLALAVGPRLPGQQIMGQPAGPQPALSIADLEAAVRARPSDVPTLGALGDAYLGAGRTSDAIGAFERALKVDPQNVPSLLGLGAILLEANRPSAAGPLFDRVLALAPDQPDALIFRALARVESDGGLTAAARADLERFLAVAPGDPRRTMAEQLLAGATANPTTSPSARPSP
ncbi:MAG: tetratricopeptide repeat protein [Chloroflexi bacterium]|nr:tetratricopeptide repeat protein [Chloroflexota bacterium]